MASSRTARCSGSRPMAAGNSPRAGRRGQCALGNRRAGPRRARRVRQCLVDLPAVAELADIRPPTTRAEVGSWTPLTVVSPLTPPMATNVPADRGTRDISDAPLSASRGIALRAARRRTRSGAGEIAGIVYLDANNNGHVDAGEAGAPNVTVVLDGRFSVQTDANGRFSFPVVATGHHVITVISDNLPLPWTLVNEGRTEVEVTTRDRTDIEHRRAASALEASHAPVNISRLIDDADRRRLSAGP